MDVMRSRHFPFPDCFVILPSAMFKLTRLECLLPIKARSQKITVQIMVTEPLAFFVEANQK